MIKLFFMINKEKILKECSFHSTRSSGKGGQNVNKVSTKVELRFDLNTSESLNDKEIERINEKLKNRISNDGVLILTSDTERTQLANKKKVIDLFFNLIEKSLIIPKKRIKTKPTNASKEKRLKDKKILSEKKRQRKQE